MKQETIVYTDGDQKLMGQLIYDEQKTGKQPAIIVFPAFEGVGDFAIEYAEELVKQGYIAFVADMYGDAQCGKTIEDCFTLITPFLEDRALVRRRAKLAFDYVASYEKIDRQRIGAIGFCFGGMCALEAARAGCDIKAVVSAHGVLSKSDLPNEKIKSRMLILHGYKDPQVPPSVIAPFAQEMEAEKVADWRFLFFGNSQHAFTDPRTGTFDPEKEAGMGREYNKTAAEATYRYALNFFAEVL